MLLTVRGRAEQTDISCGPPEILIVCGREKRLAGMVDIATQAAGRGNLDLAHLLETLDLAAIVISQSDADARKQNSTRAREDILGRRQGPDTAALSLACTEC